MTHRISCLTALAIITTAFVGGCANPMAAPAPPATIAVTDGNLQIGPVGVALPNPLLVTVTDSAGRGVAGVAVTFVPADGVVLDHTAMNTDASGHAEATATLGHLAGVETVRALAAGLISTVEFNVTAVAGTAVTLTIVSGDKQTAASGSALGAPLVIKVQDRYGNPVSGGAVIWSTTDGTLSDLSSITDFNGEATVELTLPPTAGTISVTALLNGTSASATFTATGT